MKDVSLAETRILIVEDDENNRLVTSKLLQVDGARAANIYLQEADPLPFLRALLPEKVDLILLDLQLPGKDGYEVLAELRADAEFAQIPVIAITANVMRQDVLHAQEAGFNGFLGKPINGPLFGERVLQVLAGETVWAPT